MKRSRKTTTTPPKCGTFAMMMLLLSTTTRSSRVCVALRRSTTASRTRRDLCMAHSSGRSIARSTRNSPTFLSAFLPNVSSISSTVHSYNRSFPSSCPVCSWKQKSQKEGTLSYSKEIRVVSSTQRYSVESRALRFYHSSYADGTVSRFPSKATIPFRSTVLPSASNSGSTSSSSLGGVATLVEGQTFTSATILSSQYAHQSLERMHFSTDESDGSGSRMEPTFSRVHPTTPTTYGGPNSFIPYIHLTNEEAELFQLLHQAVKALQLGCTLRVAGGWVRDKLLATPEFQRHSIHRSMRTRITTVSSTQDSNKKETNGSFIATVQRLTSKFKGPSAGRKGSKLIGVPNSSISSSSSSSSSSPASSSSLTPVSLVSKENQQPVDIDIALDNMLGREFAEKFNHWLSLNGRETHSVGVVLQNPEKSKHLETATMQVGKFWIDFVNLRAEEYTAESRIPDLMRIGTAQEDAFRRDLTINALFYNICTGQIEDWTGRGIQDLKQGVISTPLPALTTLLDDPLRVLRSIRFAARLRFTMEDNLREAAMNERVRVALDQKVSRERIGSEIDLMLRSQDPVGAMRLMVNLKLIGIVFPIESLLLSTPTNNRDVLHHLFEDGLHLLSTTHDYLCSCKVNTPLWCEKKRAMAAAAYGVHEIPLIDDEESRRKLWYASFLKPLTNYAQYTGSKMEQGLSRRLGKKSHRSHIMMLMVDELKRPVRDGEAVEKIVKAADDFTSMMNESSGLSASTVLLGNIRVVYHSEHGSDGNGRISCFMGSKVVNSETETDPIWLHAMEFRLAASQVINKIGSLWRAALILSLCEQLHNSVKDDLMYTIEGDVFQETREEIYQGIIANYDTFAASLLQLGLIGIWSQQPILHGEEIKASDVLPNLPRGPDFRDVMNEQIIWMTTHPGGSRRALIEHLRRVYPEFA